MRKIFTNFYNNFYKIQPFHRTIISYVPNLGQFNCNAVLIKIFGMKTLKEFIDKTS